MSYIIDALKKSADARAQLVFETRTEEIARPRDNKRFGPGQIWPWTIAVCALVGAVVTGLSLNSGSQADARYISNASLPSVAAHATNNSAARNMPSAPTIPTAADSARPARDPMTETLPLSMSQSLSRVIANPAVAGKKEPARSSSSGNVPLDVETVIAKVGIAAHMHSSRPEDRLLIIDGKSLREGDVVMNGVRVDEITPDGAVFSYKGFRIHRSVFN